MSTLDAIAKKGLYDALSRVSERAEKLNQNFSPGTEDAASVDEGAIVSDIIGLSTDVLQVKAMVKVVKVSQSLDDAVLDILA